MLYVMSLVHLLSANTTFQKLLTILSNKGAAELGNMWGASSSYVASAIYMATGKPLMFVTLDDDNVDNVADDITTFLYSEPRTKQCPLLTLEEVESNISSSIQTIARRMGTIYKLRNWQSATPPILVASIKAAIQPLPSPSDLERGCLMVRKGGKLSQTVLLAVLIKNEFERVTTVETEGQFSIRGGIVDIFPFTVDKPIRIELFGDSIESIRLFDVETQVSTDVLDYIDINLTGISSTTKENGCILDYLPEGCIVAIQDVVELSEHTKKFPKESNVDWEKQLNAFLSRIGKGPNIKFSDLPVSENSNSINLRITSLQRFSGALANISEELKQLQAKGNSIYIFCNNEGEELRFKELISSINPELNIKYIRGRLSKGFAFDDIGCTFLANHELFNRYNIKRDISKKSAWRGVDSFLELEKGDCVVHLHYGIGRFRGVEKLHRDGRLQEVIVLEYQDRATLYVPVSDLELVQKYIGGIETTPTLHKLGGTAWLEAKERAKNAVRDLALDMLRVQAIRETKKGIKYPEDADWQHEFEAAFPYEDTDDQIEVTHSIKQDMCSSKSMDRLICGDVGYGKTELAMRASFKASLHNKQTAILVPTTILAQQHYQAFRERMADYPVVIDVLSRFKSKVEQKSILEKLAIGGIDIIIGTHRLLQDDITFKDLGLLIIDEEQRFGVEHKERLKRLRATVDILTLTATPIPRTLHISLLGIKDISTLSTPPQDRLSIKTEICIYDKHKIRKAILYELERGGQIYFVHNRVNNIEMVAEGLRAIVPEAIIKVAHGQMHENELEEIMLEFLEKRIDVLVATTIIESGLDIPNVNTIIVNDADRFGLSDLHQLRGRVGRYKHQAYAYFLLPRDRPILPQAAKRLKAIEEFNELGAGFKIAMRDLEIRGVGNILGKEQHGHITAVGYDLYSKMLQKVMKEIKREKVQDEAVATISIAVDAYIPDNYIEDVKTRIEIYRKINRCKSKEEIDNVGREIEDRFGTMPPSLENFLKLMQVKLLALRHSITELTEVDDYLVAKFMDERNAKTLRSRFNKYIRIISNDTMHIAKPNGNSSKDGIIEHLTHILS